VKAQRTGTAPHGSAYNLVKLLEAQVTSADSTMDQVGEQRERNHRYYTMQPLGNEQRGRSHYVSPDVLDSVEGKKALFHETFLSGREVVKFESGNGVSKDGADAARAYATKVLRKNRWSDLLRDAWHDAFVAKRCVFHVDWNDQRTDETILEVDGLPFDAIAQAIDRFENIVDVDISGVTEGEDGMTGEIVVRTSDYMSEIDLIQPELYYRDSSRPYVWDSMYAGDQKALSRAQLILDGFDPDQVMGLSRQYKFFRYEEDFARKAHDRTQSTVRQHHRDELHEEVDRFRVYTWLTGWDVVNAAPDDERDIWMQAAGISEDSLDTLRLFRIYFADGEVLYWADGTPAIQRRTEIPYFEWTEFKISHAEMGLADADVTAHSQKTTSSLVRLALDNQQMRNTSRLEARKGDVLNPRDLLQNRIGGTVWSKTGNAVRALETPELSPFTLQLIQRMDYDKDRRGGQSSLGRGQNTDAIRYQNADDMIERLTNSGNRRVMKAARDFAETLMIPLVQYIVMLGARHDRQAHKLEVRGQMTTYVPAQTFPHTPIEMKAHAALTPDETAKYAQALASYYATVREDPDMKVLFGVEQKHAVFDEILDALGVTDSSPFLLSPSSPQAQERMTAIQRQNQQQANAQAMAEAFMRQMAQSADGREWLRARAEAYKRQIEVVDMGVDNERKDRELDTDIQFKARELALEERKVEVDERKAGT
jgi:hypothetical protein